MSFIVHLLQWLFIGWLLDHILILHYIFSYPIKIVVYQDHLPCGLGPKYLRYEIIKFWNMMGPLFKVIKDKTPSETGSHGSNADFIKTSIKTRPQKRKKIQILKI